VVVEALSNELIDAELSRAGHFDDSIHRSANCNPSNRFGDIISRHGLNEHWCQSNGRAVAGGVSDTLAKLEELGRVED
jgi:hypothetical protein